MKPERMNAFTDGVIAILITILVLELQPPEGHHLADILDDKGKLLAYLLSFGFVAIYWVNHHHLMQVVHRVDGRTLWANIHLLLWLSLTPIATAWLGEAGAEPGPVAGYAIVLLGCAIAYTLLTLSLLAVHEPGSIPFCSTLPFSKRQLGILCSLRSCWPIARRFSSGSIPITSVRGFFQARLIVTIPGPHPTSATRPSLGVRRNSACIRPNATQWMGW